MDRLLILICFCLWSSLSMAKPNLDSLCRCLDEAVENSSQYVKLREARIAKWKASLKSLHSVSKQYDACFALFREYSVYKNDSALSYLNRCIALAQEMKDVRRESNAKALLAFQNSTTGDYVESYSILSKMDTTQMDVEGYRNYLWASKHLYNELTYYCKVPFLKGYYEEKAKLVEQRILQSFPHDDDRYLQTMELYARDSMQFKKALKYNDLRMARVNKNSHEFAIIAYYRAVIFKQMGEVDTALYYFLQSALNDARMAVMDQGSMWELANLLNQRPDGFQRSYNYIKFAWSAAHTFNTAVRSRQILPILSTVEETYQKQITESNKQLKMMFAMLAVLLLVVLALLLYVNKQRRRLASTHKQLEQANKKLALANTNLAQSNEDLKKLNEDLKGAYESLNESNKMKEMYIGRFLRLCAVYVDKIEAMRKRVSKLVKAREFTQLNLMLQADHEYINELYDYFDSAFLKLFPNFVEEFNALLKPEERIALEDENKLTTMVRIFALIRLGIEDSSKIAEFLHYSVNTIYNYRAKVKNAALCDRDEFENKVKQIGMK